jgi:hypothetical protein
VPPYFELAAAGFPVTGKEIDIAKRRKPTDAFLDLRGQLGAVSGMREERLPMGEASACVYRPRKDGGAAFWAAREASCDHGAPSPHETD